MKRGSALLLACLMAAGLGTTAFAEEPQTVVNTENGGASISITDITPREEQEQEDETESSFQTGTTPLPLKPQRMQASACWSRPSLCRRVQTPRRSSRKA